MVLIPAGAGAAMPRNTMRSAVLRVAGGWRCLAADSSGIYTYKVSSVDDISNYLPS